MIFAEVMHDISPPLPKGMKKKNKMNRKYARAKIKYKGKTKRKGENMCKGGTDIRMKNN
jgi:hypothetical protein